MDIKETKEAIEMVGEIAVSGKKLISVVNKIKEGGITPSDIVYLKELSAVAPNMDVVKEGMKDIKLSVEELKELDKAEVIELIQCLYSMVDKVAKA